MKRFILWSAGILLAVIVANRVPALPHEYQFNLDDPAGREALHRMLAFLGPIRERAAAGRSPR